MQYRKERNGFVIRLERGEEIMQELKGFCVRQGIAAASFYGVGAVEGVEVARYDFDRKEYVTRSLNGPCELINITGDVAHRENADGEVVVHAHAVLADAEFLAVGGHLVRATVYATAEVFLQLYSQVLVRQHDPVTDLHLLQLE